MYPTYNLESIKVWNLHQLFIYEKWQVGRFQKQLIGVLNALLFLSLTSPKYFPSLFFLLLFSEFKFCHNFKKVRVSLVRWRSKTESAALCRPFSALYQLTKSFEWPAAPCTCSDWWKLPPPSQLLLLKFRRQQRWREMKTTATEVKFQMTETAAKN